jgi:hypothetical protein
VDLGAAVVADEQPFELAEPGEGAFAVVAVATGERPGERDAAALDKAMMLRAVSGSVNRARARRGAPFACTRLPSTKAGDHSKTGAAAPHG